jgi:hypothetical protein
METKLNNVMDELSIISEEIIVAESHLNTLMENRILWCKENRSRIKELYPKKGKMYQLKQLTKCGPYTWAYDDYDKEGEVYYFKPTDIRFCPDNDYKWSNREDRFTCRGLILDCNLNPVKYSEPLRVYIDMLLEVDVHKDAKTHCNKFTYVYVMIDKNTGFYKIGRSKNPETREKTLQSEKPTIELLFHHDARNKDEKILHDLYKEKRVRGEWFDLNGSDILNIKKYFSPNAN